MIIIYTDGAYSSSRDQGGWAFVVTDGKNRLENKFDGVLSTTNNRMEIQASIEALKYCKDNNIDEVTIYSDSMYVIGTMTKNWKKKANVDLWLQMDEVCKDLKITWLHIKGHNGDLNNEYCDMLAVHASQIKLN